VANEVDLSELERYLRIFQENPDSRVFAPLADLYRRLGRLNEAEEICREGISRHPYYAGGRVAFSHVLLDSGRLEECLSEVENVVTYYPDNLLARKILIRALGGLGRLERAAREFEALKAMAPLIAADPDIEKALQGPVAPRHLPAEPVAKEIFKPMEIQEKTVWSERDAAPPVLPEAKAAQNADAVLRSQRLSRLFRQKLVIESLLHALGQP